MMSDMAGHAYDDFFEPDEAPEDVLAAFERSPKVLTRPPSVSSPFPTFVDRGFRYQTKWTTAGVVTAGTRRPHWAEEPEQVSHLPVAL